jgi:hypothetical protein
MATWYSSLILALTAISSATQQSLTLYRLGCYEDCSLRLRKILGYERRRKDGSTFWTVRWTQLVVWQIPVMLLNFSILLYMAGLLTMLKERADFAGGKLSNDDVKVRVFSVTMAETITISRLHSLLEPSLALLFSATCLGCCRYTIRYSKMRHDPSLHIECTRANIKIFWLNSLLGIPNYSAGVFLFPV